MGDRGAVLVQRDSGSFAVNAQREFGISPPKYIGAAGSPPIAQAGWPL
jgi:hypothetical protein